MHSVIRIGSRESALAVRQAEIIRDLILESEPEAEIEIIKMCIRDRNMALNSFITRDGLEMGRAQVMQAEAAGVEPDVCMNPILLKPTNDTGSQVIVNGEPVGTMSAVEYYRHKKDYIPAILDAYRRLERSYDVIVIEGAGSPAELNLKQEDVYKRQAVLHAFSESPAEFQ